MAEYVGKMKSLADDMASAGKLVDDEELISYILAELDFDYNSVVSSVTGRTGPISVSDVYALLVGFESRLELLQNAANPSANTASRGGRGGGGRDGRGRGGGNPGRGGSFGRGRNDGKPKPTCQLCGKIGHIVAKCWKRFDPSFTGEEKNANTAAVNSYGIDTNWYIDSGATDHITGEMEKLMVKDKYTGNDQVHNASGAGMNIDHVGHTAIRTPTRDLTLKNVLHVPDACKSLVSAHRFTRDNKTFVELHPFFFLVKDQVTRMPLLRGRCRSGLYPLPTDKLQTISNKQAFGVVKPSLFRWHSRLGHPSFSVVNRVISQNNLPVVRDSSQEFVCDACQKGKSHQLPYPKSSSVSIEPLQLVFSDVWGPAINSVGNKVYYVSFIDDFSKFTWIYLLKHKSEVFAKFQDFQNLVERLTNRKIKAVQTDWGGEYQRLNSFFQRIGIEHYVACPYAHQQNGSAERKHRHIVEVGLSLLAHASMPLKFWDEAFTTAAYLINRTPTKVINFETPLQRLFNLPPDYSLLRTFGCACWPNLRPYNARKLAFRSKQCAFLGYSTLHKGFKCLDISTGRVYISRDVVFDEQIYPFEKLHPNAGARLRAEINLLPAHLLPLLDHGGVQMHDQPLIDDSNPANPIIENSAGSSAGNGAKSGAQHGHDFMQSSGGQPTGGHHDSLTHSTMHGTEN